VNIKLDVLGNGQGLYEITGQVADAVSSTGIRDGLANLFIRHTSASLIVQENADPAVLSDLENFLNKLIPEDQKLYSHVEEGPDDMPAHIKSALTQTHLTIPILDSKLALGTWQGIYVWEHRHQRPNRQLIITVLQSD
jgi:secondary thiamine-phosphate synthase enzyme